MGCVQLCAFFGAKTHVVWGRKIREIREDREYREVRENVDMEGKASFFFAIGIKKRGIPKGTTRKPKTRVFVTKLASH